MTLSPRLRRHFLTLHLTVSIGWVGAVVAYLVLDLTTVVADDPQTLRAAYIAMRLITWWAIVPLAFASLVTGLVMSLGTKWGLFRHYWTVISLIMTLLAVLVLMVETQTIDHLADAAADPTTTDTALRDLPSTLLHSVGGLVLLLVVLVLNVYKPAGLTRYGRRKRREIRQRQIPREGRPDVERPPHKD